MSKCLRIVGLHTPFPKSGFQSWPDSWIPTQVLLQMSYTGWDWWHQMCHPEMEGIRDGVKAEAHPFPTPQALTAGCWCVATVSQFGRGKTWPAYTKPCFTDSNNLFYLSDWRARFRSYNQLRKRLSVSDPGLSAQAGPGRHETGWRRTWFPLKGMSSWPCSYLSHSIILKTSVAHKDGARLEFGMKTLVSVFVCLPVNYHPHHQPRRPKVILDAHEIYWCFRNLSELLYLD